MFKNLKAGALSPATFGVGAAEGFDHGLIEQPTGDRVPCAQMWKEEARGAAIGAFGRMDWGRHVGVSCVAAPSAAARPRSPSPFPARRA